MAMEARLIISAEDRASATIRKIAGEVSAVGKQAGAISRTAASIRGVGVSKIGSIGAAAAQSASSVNRLTSSLRSLEGIGKGISAISAGIAGIGAAAAVVGTKTAADYQTLIARMRAGGLSDAFVGGAQTKSVELSKIFQNLSKEDVANLSWGVRRMSTSDDDAISRMDDVARVASAWKASGGAIDKFGEIFKAIDILDLGKDRGTFNAYLEGQLKAFQAGGGALRPEDAKAFADMSKQSGAALSTRFLTTTAPIMSDASGGGKFGNAVNQMIKGVISPTKEALATALDLGLVTRDDLTFNKKGNIEALKPGRFIEGSQQAITDPDLWLWGTFGPAIARRGIKPETPEFARAVQSFGGPSTADDAIADFLNQQASIQRQITDIGKAWGSSNLPALINANPTASVGSILTASKDLAGSMFAPLVENVTRLGPQIAGAIKSAEGKVASADAGKGSYLDAANEVFSRLGDLIRRETSRAPDIVSPSRYLTAGEQELLRSKRSPVFASQPIISPMAPIGGVAPIPQLGAPGPHGFGLLGPTPTTPAGPIVAKVEPSQIVVPPVEVNSRVEVAPLTGEATITGQLTGTNVTVTLDRNSVTSYIDAKINQSTVRLASTGGSAGTTGRSMPEAAPRGGVSVP